jgi:hypothetical protein
MGANAVTTVPVYVAGEVLTAADMNITNSGIPVFADSTARDAAFGGTGEKVLAEGQYAYLESTNATQFYDGAAWLALGGKLGQVVSVIKTDTFTTSSASFVDVTDLSVTITPTSTSSKIMILGQVAAGGNSGGSNTNLRFTGGNSGTYVGDASGGKIQALTGGFFDANLGNVLASYALNYLDSPATVSATTYKIQVRAGAVGANTAYINRTSADNDVRGASSLTVMEILA